MLNGFNRKVDIQPGPVQMVRLRPFDVEDRRHRRFPEPRKVIEGKE